MQQPESDTQHPLFQFALTSDFAEPLVAHFSQRASEPTFDSLDMGLFYRLTIRGTLSAESMDRLFSWFIVAFSALWLASQLLPRT